LGLGVEVNANRLASAACQRGCKVQSRGGFSYATFLIENSDYSHDFLAAVS
jgi:hypothetical protein